MAIRFDNGFISDLTAVRDNINLRVRIVRTWMQPLHNKPNVVNMELIIMDEKGTKMQATVRMALVPIFKQQLSEGDAVMLRMYSLGQIQPNYRIVDNPLRLNFVSKTQVSRCVDFKGSVHGFDFKPFTDILNCQNETVGQFDIIGQVIESSELDNYSGNGKPGKKKPLKLIDPEGTELNCMLWGDFADQFTEFLKSCNDVGLLILVIQLDRMKKWDGVMQVQNGFWGTKLFMHNGKESIMNNDLEDIEAFRNSLLARPDNERSTNTGSKISTASKFSAHEEFVDKYPYRNIGELLDLQTGEVSIIVATVLFIQEEEGWWYLGCTRLRVDRLMKSCIDATIINGSHFGKRVLIARMKISPSDKCLPLKIIRKQFPVSVSFAMTINKSQGQSLGQVGLYLPRHVFTHGQLYVAVSRVRSKKGLKMVIRDEEGNLTNTTTNVVYKEVLHNL